MIFEPKGPQTEGIRWLLQHSYGGLFWDPGRGKTITVLEAFKILRDEGLVRNMLVTSSVNVVDDVWPSEIEKWDDLDLTYALLRGGEKKRASAMDLEADVYLINNENLWWLQETFSPKLGIDMLVVDESSKFRNGRLHSRQRKTKKGHVRRSAFSALVKMLPHFKRRVIMTGTPIPRSYLNLWPQMYICDRGETLGQSLTKYRNDHFYPTGYDGTNWILRDGEAPKIQAKISKRVHRAERDNAVPIEFFDLVVRLPPDARAAYREIEKEFITEWRGKTLVAAHAGAATAKLRQGANGALYFQKGSKDWIEFHDRKITALSELIDELQGSPLLVAFEFEHDYQMMLRAKLPVEVYRGSKQQKDELKRAWESGELPVLAAQIQSVSHGLNLQYGGHNVAFYGLTYNLDDYEQAYQRIWRQGQTKPVVVYNIVAEDTVDDVMMEVLESRSKQQIGFLSALKRKYKL